MSKIKIVITGGPCAGKTTLIEALQKDFGQKISFVPEAASILYRGGFPRRTSALGKKHAQRAICFVQRELEDLLTQENKVDAIICDRGSLDAIAYWPGDESDFYQSIKTTKEKEFLRYDWVIHLDTAEESYFQTNTSVRIESHKEALELNQLTKQAWAGHPQRLFISHKNDFVEKMILARTVIQMILNQEPYDKVLRVINKSEPAPIN